MYKSPVFFFWCATSLILFPVISVAQDLPTGQKITPNAIRGARFSPLKVGIGPHPEYIADGASNMALSGDGKWLAVLTSGFNKYNDTDGKVNKEQSQQYIFLYSVGKDGAKLSQVITTENAFYGIAWTPDNKSIAVSGGVDDCVRFYDLQNGKLSASGEPVKLNHKEGIGLEVKPQVAGLGFSPDGKYLLIANYYNDSVSLIDATNRKLIGEQDLRPGKIDAEKIGVAGGEFPFGITWRDNQSAFISAARDREIVLAKIADGKINIIKRQPVLGEPTAIMIDKARKNLLVVEDNSDRVAIFDANSFLLKKEIRVSLPIKGSEQLPKGLNINNIAQIGTGQFLLTLGGINAIALLDTQKGTQAMMPTAWYPSAIAYDSSSKMVFVANRKSPPGPNKMGCQPKVASTMSQAAACGANNQYIFQLEKAGFMQFKLPTIAERAKLTKQVAQNIGYNRKVEMAQSVNQMSLVRTKIKHVIFIIKENRTYDQILGDLEIGNGDPKLAILGEGLSPNHHSLARNFVTFDNFYNSGEQSSTGWSWSTAARATDILEKTAPVNYSGRGLAYDSEGSSRNLNTSVPPKERKKLNYKAIDDDDVLPGKRQITGPDGDDDNDENEGFIWYQALRAGLSVRNYGFANEFVYDNKDGKGIPPIHDPYSQKLTVYFSGDKALSTRSDEYYRGFDLNFPDYWRIQEWSREFDEFQTNGNLPTLSLLRIGNDHFGDFKTAIDGVNSVETQMADNDFALGLLVEKVANSKYKDDTLIFVIEDDAQNGADHVDARRSVAFIIGPYVKQKALISSRYTTVSILRTMEEVLGLKPLGVNDAFAVPMADAFDINQKDWNYKAVASQVLKTTNLPISEDRFAIKISQTCKPQSANYWANAMQGQNFSLEDRLDTNKFNLALWHGLSGDELPQGPNNYDLRQNRSNVLALRHISCP